MSLILDAINKSEREKDSNDTVPDLKTVHSKSAEQSGTGSFHKTWMIIISALLAGLLIVLAVLLISFRYPAQQPAGQTSPPSAEQQQMARENTDEDAVSQTKAANKAEPANANGATPVEAGRNNGSSNKTAKAPSDEVAALYGDAKEAPPLVIEPTAEPATVIQPSQNSVDEELARQLWQETQRLMPTRRVASNREESVAEPEAPPATLTAPFDETLAAFEGTPFLHELSVSVQNSIPTLMYALHKYDEQQVVINKKTYRQGDDLGGGVVIESILADGLILNFNSYQFKLAALNSWVNY